MGKWNDALAAYEASAQLIASSNLSQDVKANAQSGLHYNRASVALDNNELLEARKETDTFRASTDVGRNLNQMRLGHELVGRIAFAEKKYDMAVDELLQSNQQNPYNLFRLALAYRAKGDKVKAKEFCTKATHFYSLPAANYSFIRLKAEKLLSNM
jgi:tetratricopeptide (TPR) repeat protein